MDEDGANRLLARRLGIREEEITVKPTTTHTEKKDDVLPQPTGNAFIKRLSMASHRVEEASRTAKETERAYLARMSGAWKDATQELAGKGGSLGMQCRWGSIALGLSHLNLGSDHVANSPDAAATVAAGPIPAEIDLSDREVSSVLRQLMTHCDACRDMAKTIAALEDARRDWVGTPTIGAAASEEHALASELLRERVEGVRLAKGWWTEKAKADISTGGKPLLFLPPDSGTTPGIETEFLSAHFVPASNIGKPTTTTVDGTGYRVSAGKPIYGRVIRQRDSVAVDALGPVIELDWAMVQPVSRSLARTPLRKKEK